MQDRGGNGAITVDEVPRRATAKITSALAGQPRISGQQMTLAGNARWVPAWPGPAIVAPVAVLAAARQRRVNPADPLAEVHRQR